jgi:hypothetical protein
VVHLEIQFPLIAHARRRHLDLRLCVPQLRRVDVVGHARAEFLWLRGGFAFGAKRIACLAETNF